MISTQRGVLAVAASALALAGCYDELPNARIVNNSGESLRLVVRPGGDGEHTMEFPLGETSRRIGAYGAERRFLLIRGDCSYRYIFPPMGVNYPFEVYGYAYPVRLQVQPDMAVHLLPGSARSVTPVPAFEDSPARGFPLRPVSTSCEAEKR